MRGADINHCPSAPFFTVRIRYDESPALYRAEDQPTVAGIGFDACAVRELALQQLESELVLDLALDEPLERARTVRGIEATFCQEFPGFVREHERDAPLAESLLQAAQLDVHDRAE